MRQRHVRGNLPKARTKVQSVVVPKLNQRALIASSFQRQLEKEKGRLTRRPSRHDIWLIHQPLHVSGQAHRQSLETMLTTRRVGRERVFCTLVRLKNSTYLRCATRVASCYGEIFWGAHNV